MEGVLKLQSLQSATAPQTTQPHRKDSSINHPLRHTTEDSNRASPLARSTSSLGEVWGIYPIDRQAI